MTETRTKPANRSRQILTASAALFAVAILPIPGAGTLLSNSSTGGTPQFDQGLVPANPGVNPPRVCYLIADNDGQPDTRDVLSTIDPVTGIETVVGRTGTDFVEALAYSPFRSTLYALDGGQLGSLNLFSGKFSPIGKVGHGIGALGDRTFSDIDGLTVDPDTGVLYGSVRQTSDNLLVQINPETGSIVDHAFGITHDYVPVGPLDPGLFIDDLAASPLDGKLYGVATDSTRTLLVTIDKISGRVTIVTSVDAVEVEGLSFDLEGRLYGTIGSAGRKVVVIDVVTGAVEPLYPIGADGNFDYEAIDCVTFGSLPEPEFVPSDTRAPGDVRIEGAYPVPASTAITLRVRFTKTLNASLDVFDGRGRRVLEQPERTYGAGIYDVPLSIGKLPQGTYNYRWRSRLQDTFGSFVVAR